MEWELILLFGVTAFFYSSVGFGGGSTYLALLALYNWPFESLRISALILNISVVSGNLIRYQRNNLIPWKTSLLLVLFSMPMAFVGGVIELGESVFFILLAIALLLAGIGILFRSITVVEINRERKLPPVVAGISGGAIGLLSGLVGIGGGVFLSPALYYSRRFKIKQISAICSLFILLNSISGLMGNSIRNNGFGELNSLLPLLIAVVIGGQIGNFIAVERASPKIIGLLTAILIIFVGLRILYKEF